MSSRRKSWRRKYHQMMVELWLRMLPVCDSSAGVVNARGEARQRNWTPQRFNIFWGECYWFWCTSISGMCADLALCSCRKNLPGCGKSPPLADQGARWPYRLSPGKRVIIAMSWWQRQRWQYKDGNCNEDNGDDNETRGHLSLQHVLLLEIGLHVCRHPKMPIFYSGQVCEKEQSKLERTHIREKRWWGCVGW